MARGRISVKKDKGGQKTLTEMLKGVGGGKRGKGR